MNAIKLRVILIHLIQNKPILQDENLKSFSPAAIASADGVGGADGSIRRISYSDRQRREKTNQLQRRRQRI